MTADIKFEGFKTIKPSSLKWERNIDNYSDTATIVIPAMCRLVDGQTVYDNVVTGQQIPEGTKVEIHAGYDGNNPLRFKGFVNRINFKVPVEIECEGYSYQLRRKLINKTFGKTTVRTVLQYLIDGTDIRLSDKMPEDIVFEPFPFKNYTGVQVLDFLKEKYLLTVFFFFDELYVGWRATFSGAIVKHRLNWNVIKDDALLFNTYTGAVVHIELESTTPGGHKKRCKAANVIRPGDVKRKKVYIKDQHTLQAAANDAQLLENKKGYTGAITAFLLPYAEPGMTTEIIDKKYEERNGSYFIESVSGSFGPQGGRQKIGIGFTVSNNG
jgi:hypothetical protein